MPQPVWKAKLPSPPIAEDVPPTAVTYGSETGKSVCRMPVLASSSPLSPLEYMKLMPCIAPCRKTCS